MKSGDITTDLTEVDEMDTFFEHENPPKIIQKPEKLLNCFSKEFINKTFP